MPILDNKLTSAQVFYVCLLLFCTVSLCLVYRSYFNFTYIFSPIAQDSKLNIIWFLVSIGKLGLYMRRAGYVSILMLEESILVVEELSLGIEETTFGLPEPSGPLKVKIRRQDHL